MIPISMMAIAILAVTPAQQTGVIPSGTVHEVKNVGSGSASALATYVVEKGKPLVVLVK